MREEGAAQRRLEPATHDRMTSLELIVRFPLKLSIRSTFELGIIPDDVALYMDVDVVLMRDLTELFAMDLGDRPVAAVRDMWRPNLHEALAGGGSGRFAPDAPYFNTGVMLCNLRQWRREGLTERVLHWLASQDRVPDCLEQDALNALTHGRWIGLDPRWNVTPQRSRRHQFGATADKDSAFNRSAARCTAWMCLRTSLIGGTRPQ